MENKIIAFAVGCLEGGGTERVISIWSSELAKKGMTVYIITYYRSDDEYQVDEKVRFRPIAETKTEFLRLAKKDRLIKARQVLKLISADYMISFLPSMQIIMSIASFGIKTKRIETVRNNPWIIKSELGLIKKLLWKRCFRTANKIIVQGKSQAEFFNRKYSDRIRTIPNPISEMYLSGRSKVYTKPVTEFVAVGRIDEQKNYPLMIRAFSRAGSENKDIRLKIYGSGSPTYTEKIARLIDECGMTDRIILMGRSNRIDEVYRSSDVLLMTSDYEGMPNALVEAMASGLLCVSSDCKTGPSDLITNGENGFLFPCGDENTLTELILSVCSMMPNMLKDLGEKAKAKVTKTCDVAMCTEKLCSCFE